MPLRRLRVLIRHLPVDGALGRAVNGASSTLEEIGFLTLEMLDSLWRTVAVTADRQYRSTWLTAGAKWSDLPPPLELGAPLRIARTGQPAPDPDPAPDPGPGPRQATPSEILATFNAARGK